MAGRRIKKSDNPPPPSDLSASLSIKEYEKSKAWKDKSKKILDDKSIVCVICKRARWRKYKKKPGWKRVLRFSVHHVRYSNIPNEKPEDLMILCQLCHSTFHALLRYRHISEVYEKIAQIVEQYFFYDKYEEE